MKLILFMFAGRQVNMEVQKPYLDNILRMHPEAELHLWDLTRTPADQTYLYSLDGAHAGRVQVMKQLHPGHPLPCLYPDGYPDGTDRRPRGWRKCECMKHKPPYEMVYDWYSTILTRPETVYVKIDDDVLFLETHNFAHLVGPLAQYPNRVISANVYNNAVCAKYQPDVDMTMEKFGLGDPTLPKNDRAWWALHTMPEFASWSHAMFLNNYEKRRDWQPGYVRTRPGEAVSINCIAFTHATLVRVANMMSDRLGDEGAMDRMLPWICTSFNAAHLTFGDQDKRMHADVLDQIRDQYVSFRKDYLG